MRADLDDAALDRVLSFVNEPAARPCCKSWATTLYDSLYLEQLISFKKYLHGKGGSCHFHHTAVRMLGPEFEECATYQFEFFEAENKYKMQWCRNFDAWSAENERQVGTWSFVNGNLHCETKEGPAISEKEVRYAPAGRVFEIPIESVLLEHSKNDDKVLPWERPSRGLIDHEAAPNKEQIAAYLERKDDGVPTGGANDNTPEDTRQFVDIDGETHEVSKDIQDNYPAEQWERLMRCRVRFGING